MKGLSPDATFSTFSLEVHYYIVHSNSKLQEEFLISFVHKLGTLLHCHMRNRRAVNMKIVLYLYISKCRLLQFQE